MNELWKDIPNYIGLYQVSNLGKVKSLKRVMIRKNGVKCSVKEKIIKQRKGSTGYCEVTIWELGIKKNHKVHRLVMSAFFGLSELHVNHKNGVKTDNLLSNLEYCKPLYNNNHYNIVLKNQNKYGLRIKKDRNSWGSEIWIGPRHLKDRRWLGSYDNKEDAFQAFFNAYYKHYGKKPWKGEYRKIIKKKYGIYWDKSKKKFTAQICINYKNIFLGRCDCKEEAYLIFYESYYKYHGVSPW